MSAEKSIESLLSELFEAERRVRQVHESLCDKPEGELLSVAQKAIAEAAEEAHEDEASLKLVRLASLLGEFEGPRVVDALIDIVATDHEEARRAAGEELEALAFERFKEVAEGIERALKRLPVGSPALSELPYIVAEVPEPGIAKLLGLVMAHEDPDAVAAAIEVAVEIGEPGVKKHLERLKDDKRTVELAEVGEEAGGEITLGELAEEALTLLGEVEPGGNGARGRDA